jgi:hypothetical protein
MVMVLCTSFCILMLITCLLWQYDCAQDTLVVCKLALPQQIYSLVSCLNLDIRTVLPSVPENSMHAHVQDEPVVERILNSIIIT